MYADLHIHTWYSDGTLSPEEIVKKAKAQDFTLISICDHECTEAYPELFDLCAANNINLITGVELLALMDDKEYHILAYNFDAQNKALRGFMKHNRGILLDKGAGLIEKISADYADVSIQEFSKYERNRKNGGWDSIDYLKSKNLVETWPDFVDLARKYPVELDKDFLCAEEAIKIIHNAGGYAVLAHPGDHNGQNPEACEKEAVKFLEIGIDGFECYYPLYSAEFTGFLVKFCRKHDLIITAGSDEHGGFNDAWANKYYIGAVKIKTEKLNLKDMV